MGGEMAEKEPIPAHCRDTLTGAIGGIGGSSPQAGEFLLKTLGVNCEITIPTSRQRLDEDARADR